MSENEMSSSFQLQSLYPWLTSDWQQLFSAHQPDGDFPHALLLSGVAGLGKTDLAFYLAKSLLCQSPVNAPKTGQLQACHQCRSCQLFSAGNHPDLLYLTTPEEKKIIPVDAIRELIQWSVLSSQLNGRKIIIIEPAEAMNPNAANSLLKTLEEPVADTIIIMVTHKKQALLATIKSRCQIRDIVIPDKQLVLDWLEQQGLQQAPLLLSLASGAPLQAVKMADQTKLNTRKQIIRHLLSVHESDKDPVLVADELVKLTKKTKSKEAQASSFDIIYWLDVILTDIARLKHIGQIEGINNVDFFQDLQQLINRLYLKNILQLSDSVNKAYYEIQGAININLLFEKLLIDWKNCNQ